jgi:hypothetical protein
MAYFALIMISTTYDQRRETARFARRKESFRFCRFSGSSRPKTQWCELDGGFKARVADVARLGSATRKWRRKPLESLKMDSEVAGRPFLCGR